MVTAVLYSPQKPDHFKFNFYLEVSPNSWGHVEGHRVISSWNSWKVSPLLYSVIDYLWQFVFSALKCKLLQLSSALYPAGRGGCSIGFDGGETSMGYSMIFSEAV